MSPNFSSNKYRILFVVFSIAIISLIVSRTPIQIPNGFPYSAKTIPTDQMPQNTNQLQVTFVDRTLEKGLNFVHQQGDEQLAGIDETLGSGACAADFNNDGWVDLFLVNGSGHTRYYGKEYWWQKSQGNAMFFNVGGQSFKDVTIEAGLDKKIWGMGCLATDFDNDGNVDILVTGKETKLLYKNNGNGAFTDYSQESGLTGDYWSTSAAAADFNNDGLVDIYIGNFIGFKKGNKTFEANSQFASEKKNTFDSSLYEAQPNQLYLNVGGLKFKEIALEVGVNDLDGRTLDVSWQDMNSDGLPDLLVTNDRGTGSNTAYLNKGNQHFEAGGQSLGLRSALGNRGISSGDLNKDGDMDLLIASNIGENTVALIKEQSSEGKYSYKDRSRENGIGANQFLNLSAWSPLVQDFNNDGYNDVFLIAGLLEPDADTGKVTQGQPKQILLNTGKGSFTDMTANAGIALSDTQSGRGGVAADFDNDGDIDVYIAHNNDLGQYLANESPKKHWLGIKLIGKLSNREALGARVQLVTTQGTQAKTLVSGEGFLSDSDKRLVFGLGDEAKIDHLKINWPSGKQQIISSISADQYWLIEEGSNEVKALHAEPAELPSLSLRLKLGIDQPGIRSRYLNMLTQTKLDDLAWQELTIAAKDPDSKIRHDVITAVAHENSIQGLKLLTQSLEDKDSANVVAAIAGLQLYEDENSIRWLLRLFSHPDSAVKIALANSFAYFFQEEEAVEYRKYLAVPYLIRLLDDPEPQVRVAAAKALANAERFRGVHVLLEHMQDSDSEVKAEIIRTLGLIRQTQAITPIRALLLDETQPPQVIANAFIALKRMGEDNVLQTLNSFAMGQKPYKAIPIEKRVQVLAELTSKDQEVVVLDAGQLNSIVQALFNKYSASKFQPQLAERLSLCWIEILRHFPDKLAMDWLDKQTHSSSSVIRNSAFPAEFALNQPERLAILQRAWSDQDVSIKKWALNELVQQKIPLTLEDYQKILASTELQAIASQIWSQPGYLLQPELLQKGLSPNMSGTIDNKQSNAKLSAATAAKNALVAQQNQPPLSLDTICTNSEAQSQKFCSLLVFSENTPEHQAIAKKLIQNTDLDISLRQEILNRYDSQFDADAINVLYALAQLKTDPMHNNIIVKLFSLEAGSSLTGFAEKVANNTAEKAEIRFQAIDYLTRQGQTTAREILYR